MATCTFFGHRECPETVKQNLRCVLVDLIEYKNVDAFYVGSQGQFDRIVRSVLADLSDTYPHISYGVVLAYLPPPLDLSPENTMYPEGMETVPRRFAIDYRNQWMLRRADCVVTYITHSWGGAWKYAAMAQHRGIPCISVVDAGI